MLVSRLLVFWCRIARLRFVALADQIQPTTASQASAGATVDDINPALLIVRTIP